MAKASFVIVGQSGLLDSEGGGELLGAQEARPFMALTARGNYLACDRAGIQFAVQDSQDHFIVNLGSPKHEPTGLALPCRMPAADG